jgi:hypothetical protein
MKYFIWAAPHKPSAMQKEELKEKGALIHLEDISPELYLDLINLESNSNLNTLVGTLIDILSDFKDVTLVEPAGSHAFQYALGMHNIQWPVLYSFSEEKLEDVPQKDGTMKQIPVLEHKNWIEL